MDWAITVPAFLFPALGGGLFGYDIGATSGALLSLTSSAVSGTDWYARWLSCHSTCRRSARQQRFVSAGLERHGCSGGETHMLYLESIWCAA